ncbi:protein of unknown function [Candidatus Promineifilum breve]|uniref:Uncharacterized protein n=1 Tax=Candidatus Promineifilum breve TaxID=1806508 RepID=A0A160T350_9CHLR|nr:protein of unknown function [Candidatus Promineifilum breve]
MNSCVIHPGAAGRANWQSVMGGATPVILVIELTVRFGVNTILFSGALPSHRPPDTRP